MADAPPHTSPLPPPRPATPLECALPAWLPHLAAATFDTVLVPLPPDLAAYLAAGQGVWLAGDSRAVREKEEKGGRDKGGGGGARVSLFLWRSKCTPVKTSTSATPWHGRRGARPPARQVNTRARPEHQLMTPSFFFAALQFSQAPKGPRLDAYDERCASWASDEEEKEHADAGSAAPSSPSASSSSGGTPPPARPPPASAAALAAVVDAAIASLGGRVLPKLNWSAPVDAAWLVPNNCIACENADEVRRKRGRAGERERAAGERASERASDAHEPHGEAGGAGQPMPVGR